MLFDCPSLYIIKKIISTYKIKSFQLRSKSNVLIIHLFTKGALLISMVGSLGYDILCLAVHHQIPKSAYGFIIICPVINSNEA
jgi:hypothetical protein